jgi:hypothetical protein
VNAPLASAAIGDLGTEGTFDRPQNQKAALERTRGIVVVLSGPASRTWQRTSWSVDREDSETQGQPYKVRL